MSFVSKMAVLLFKERCVKIFEIVLPDFCYEPNDIRGDIDNRRLQQSGIITDSRSTYRPTVYRQSVDLSADCRSTRSQPTVGRQSADCRPVGFRQKSFSIISRITCIDKHAPLRTASKRKTKQLLKPWIIKGLLKSIRVKNRLFYLGKTAEYKLYRNKISTLIRLSKKLYFHNFFCNNICNMKKTWEGINNN